MGKAAVLGLATAIVYQMPEICFPVSRFPAANCLSKEIPVNELPLIIFSSNMISGVTKFRCIIFQ